MKTLDFDNGLMPNDRDFDRMKAELFDRIDVEERQAPVQHLVPVAKGRRRSRRRTAWAGASVLAAAALAVTLVAGNVFGPHAATAEAAEVLHDAALASIHSSDPVVGPGQYLKVETTEVALGSGVSPAGRQGSYEQPQATTVYIPADPADTWVIGRQWLPAGKVYGDAQWMVDDFWKNPQRGDLKLYQAVGGVIHENGESYNDLGQIQKLPHDPDALFAYLYDHAQGSMSKDEAVFERIRTLLMTGLVPADLRAAMYEALARVPGVYLSEGQANLDGREGIAIARKEPLRPELTQIIIDPDTGLLIGVREVLTDANGPVPAGTVEDWTAVTTSVVDEAPAGPYSIMPPPG